MAKIVVENKGKKRHTGELVKIGTKIPLSLWKMLRVWGVEANMTNEQIMALALTEFFKVNKDGAAWAEANQEPDAEAEAPAVTA